MPSTMVIWKILYTCLLLSQGTYAFVTSPLHNVRPVLTLLRRLNDNDDNNNNNNDDDISNNNQASEAERLRQRAEELREQIRKMEEALGDNRGRPNVGGVRSSVFVSQTNDNASVDDAMMTLRNKRVLVVGANGRLGSMVCRHLLRNHPNTKVIAAVHTVGVDSPTARGYARLSYEVGAEDGIGYIGPAWSEEERTATFQYDAETMSGHNLRNLRVVECELLDPVQCATITEDVDAIIWCATDFNGNTPRAISGLNLAFLVRAVANPKKGRVEIEGLRNLLSGLVRAKQDRKWKSSASSRNGLAATPVTTTTAAAATTTTSNDPISFIMVSTTPDAFDNFETPLGSFIGIKQEAEQILRDEFPSVTHSILRFGRFEDFFVREGMDVEQQLVRGGSSSNNNNNNNNKKKNGVDVETNNWKKGQQRCIHRRDAARATVEALTNPELLGQTSEVWTSIR